MPPEMFGVLGLALICIAYHALKKRADELPPQPPPTKEEEFHDRQW